jgi:signal transduction histidine kinase
MVAVLVLVAQTTSLASRAFWWAALVLAFRGVVEALYFFYQRAADRERHARRWGWRYTIAVSISACAWGSAAFLLTGSDSALTQVIVLCLAFRAAASMLTHAYFPPALYTSTVPLVLAVALYYATLGGRSNLLICAIWFLFLWYALLTGHRQARSVLNSIALRYDNEKLVDELQQKNTANAEARFKAEQASLARSQFFAAANHDLRQPLHSLGLFATALRNIIPEQGKQRELIDQVMQSVESLELLFDDVLDISRLDSGQVKVQLDRFPVTDLMERLRAAYAVPAAQQHLKLRVRASKEMLWSDKTLLFRVLSNLVSNALRYTKEGGVLVATRWRRSGVRIEVWDSGVGIPGDQQERIFEEFYQLHNPERDRRKGLGLGLATVRRIVDLLGYQLTVRSTPGRGSVFRLDLPAHLMAPAAVPGITRTEEMAVPDLLSEKTIMVIDDEISIQMGMQSLLQSWGCKCVAAAGIEDALRLAQGRAPDFIVADLRLQNNVTGIEAIHTVRAALGKNIPAVLISGDTAPERLREISNAGLTILHKPLKPMRLRALLNHEFARRSSAQKSGHELGVSN